MRLPILGLLLVVSAACDSLATGDKGIVVLVCTSKTHFHCHPKFGCSTREVVGATPFSYTVNFDKKTIDGKPGKISQSEIRWEFKTQIGDHMSYRVDRYTKLMTSVLSGGSEGSKSEFTHTCEVAQKAF
jgi:hypothetical protein